MQFNVSARPITCEFRSLSLVFQTKFKTYRDLIFKIIEDLRIHLQETLPSVVHQVQARVPLEHLL